MVDLLERFEGRTERGELVHPGEEPRGAAFVLGAPGFGVEGECVDEGAHVDLVIGFGECAQRVIA